MHTIHGQPPVLATPEPNKLSHLQTLNLIRTYGNSIACLIRCRRACPRSPGTYGNLSGSYFARLQTLSDFMAGLVIFSSSPDTLTGRFDSVPSWSGGTCRLRTHGVVTLIDRPTGADVPTYWHRRL